MLNLQIERNDVLDRNLKLMEFTAAQIAEVLGGKVEGNADVKVSAPARIENGKPGTICFFANPKYEKYVYTSKCDILIVNEDFVAKEPVRPTLVRVKDSYAAVASLLDYISSAKKAVRRYRSCRAVVRCSAHLGRKVYVGAFAYVGRKVRIGNGTRISEQVYVGDGTVIGDNCILYPGVKIYPGSVIGNNVILHAGVVIGSDGFGFAPLEDGTYRKIQHTGNVIIEDDVEIGANTTVDKSQIGSTIIHKGVKLDNLCQVAHNVEIGENTVIASQSGIAGSAKLGRHCVIGGQCGIVGHIEVPANTTLAGQSAVMGNIREEGQVLMGSPAFQYKKYMRCYAIFKAAADKKD